MLRASHLSQGGYYQQPNDGSKREQQEIPQRPFDDAYRVRSPANEQQTPSGDDNAALPATVRQGPTPGPQLEETYHVFSKVQKMLVMSIVGFSALFSGLRSNIYFPSLDAIAKAS